MIAEHRRRQRTDHARWYGGHAIGVSLDDIGRWGAMLARALEETGGPPSTDERAWTDGILEAGEHGRRSNA